MPERAGVGISHTEAPGGPPDSQGMSHTLRLSGCFLGPLCVSGVILAGGARFVHPWTLGSVGMDPPDGDERKPEADCLHPDPLGARG